MASKRDSLNGSLAGSGSVSDRLYAQQKPLTQDLILLHLDQLTIT
jgi:hypothetical protein